MPSAPPVRLLIEGRLGCSEWEVAECEAEASMLGHAEHGSGRGHLAWNRQRSSLSRRPALAISPPCPPLSCLSPCSRPCSDPLPRAHPALAHPPSCPPPTPCPRPPSRHPRPVPRPALHPALHLPSFSLSASLTTRPLSLRSPPLCRFYTRIPRSPRSSLRRPRPLRFRDPRAKPFSLGRPRPRQSDRPRMP